MKTNNPEIRLADEKLTIGPIRPDPMYVTFCGHKDDEFIRFEFSHSGKFNIVQGEGIKAINHPAKIFFARLEQHIPYEFKNAWYWKGENSGIKSERKRANYHRITGGLIGCGLGLLVGVFLTSIISI